MLRGWLLLLVAFLLVWMPLTFSGELNATLPSIAMRGSAAVLELLVHAATTALAVAAGLALVRRDPHGPMFAVIALAGSCAAVVQSMFWSVLPRQTMPGDRTIVALASIVHAAVWIAYLRRSRRVRAIYG
jgi:hypothetical protein